MKTIPKRRRRTGGPSREQKGGLHSWLGERVEPRVDLDRLDDGEVEFLLDLKREGTGLRALTGKRLSRFEQVVEKGAGLEAGHFARLRSDHQAFAEIRALGRKLGRRPPTAEAEGALLAELHAQMAGGCLWVEHVGALIVLLATFAEGAAPDGSALQLTRSEDGEPVLVYDTRRSLFGKTIGSAGGYNVRELLQHLAANSWIEVRNRRHPRVGPELEIRLGVRARRVLRGPSTQPGTVSGSSAP